MVKRLYGKFLDTSGHIALIIKISKFLYSYGILGRLSSRLIDKVIRIIYCMEVSSFSIDVNELSVGHSVGVVLGGNGIQVNGTLRVASGVVFGRKLLPNLHEYHASFSEENYLFRCNGDLTVGANTVLLGPITIVGPTVIGAMSLVDKDIVEAGTYVGNPLRRIR
jgi:serine acetyltransferase